MSLPADWKMPAGFHDFEKSYGALSLEQLPTIDWTNKAMIELLFPAYRRAANKMAAEGMNTKQMNAAKKIELENFKLMTPNEDQVLFQNTKLIIEQRKRSAMYGVNGVGKTVLFEAMQKGTMKGFPKHLHVHHMHELEHHPEAEKLSVYDTIINAHPLRRVLIICESTLKTKIEAASDEAVKEKLQENLKFIEAQLRSISSATANDRIVQMLRVLGFDETGEKRLLSELSGGLRMRVALASAFFIDPELLLLDEPTNHLDFPSVLWLENRLRGYKGAFVVVTHDRQLLENVCTSVMLLQDKKISYYNTSFTQFEKTKWKEDEAKDQMIDKFMARNRKVDPTSMVARQKKDYAAWQEKHRAHRVMLAGKFTFKPPPFLKGVPEGAKPEDVSLINMKDLRFSYNPEGGQFIFNQPISFDCNLGTRVGVMGPNGAGKSTFLKLLTGKLTPTTGAVTSHPDYRLAYFGQHSTKELDMEDTPKEFMCKSFPEEKAGTLVGHLGKTSVNNDAANTRMKNLSYSQRSCVIFAKLTFVPPHVLIMDEPTNFLDLDSVDSLIAATNKFKGALLVVTHSRDFLKRCATTFLSIVPGRFLTFNSMKEAESSTYSFIAAMEDGERINAKNLIAENPGGGSVHHSQIGDGKAKKKKVEDQTDADGNLVMSSINLDGSKKSGNTKTAAQRKREEEAEAKKIKEEKKAKKAAARAARKTDWKVGDTPFAQVGKGKSSRYEQATVTKVTGMGIIVSVGGKNVMVDANKLHETNPSPQKPATSSRGGRGGRVTGGGNQRGPAAKSGGRQQQGGGRGGRQGGGRGGRGNQTGRSQTNNQTGGGNRNQRRQNNQHQPRGKVRSGSERS